MLDFYYLPHELAPPESPDEIEFALGLSLEDFESLEKLWLMLRDHGLELSYFSDSLIPAPEVSRAVSVLGDFERDLDVKSRQKIEIPLSNFRSALISAANRRIAICSYCD